MDWAALNAHEKITRDRFFQVTMRPGQDGEKRTVTVKLTAAELGEMAQTGPLWPQMNAAAINKAKALPLGGFQWWGDPVEEVVH
jgi:hypothetical protein